MIRSIYKYSLKQIENVRVSIDNKNENLDCSGVLFTFFYREGEVLMLLRNLKILSKNNHEIEAEDKEH